MIRNVIPILVFILVIIGFSLLWWSAPQISIELQKVTQASLSSCSPASENLACNEAFARLGQMGDLFGVVSSLFSGLAMLGVALTLWLDTSSRRNGRKPVVVCQISDEKPVVFDEPSTTKPRAVRVLFNLNVSAINDVAMNVVITASFENKKWNKAFDEVSVPVPLASDGKPGVAVSLALRLDAENISKMSECLRSDQRLILQIKAVFQSLEGVTWYTEMQYILRFRQADAERLLSLNDDDEKCVELWSNQVTVQADAAASSGSWRHYH